MKKLLSACLATAALSTVLYSCNKEDNSAAPAPDKGSYTSLSSMLNALAPTAKKLSLDAANGGSFYGNSGTRYVFQPDAFVFPDGTAVSGTVDLEVMEVLKPDEMIYSGILPMSNEESLVSGGEIFVRASQDGQELLLKPRTTFTAKMPANGSDGSSMSVFYGTLTGNALNKVSWATFTDTSHFGSVSYDGDTVSLFSDSLEYTNADRYISNPDYQKVNIRLSGISTLVDTRNVVIYTVYDDYNGVSHANGSYSAGLMTNATVPRIKVHLVAIAIEDGYMYAGISDSSITAATGSTYTIKLGKTTPAAFKTTLKAL